MQPGPGPAGCAGTAAVTTNPLLWDYRVIYSIDHNTKVVTIAVVGHRREKPGRLMFPPPWGIFPPRQMVTRTPRTGCSRDSNAWLVIAWRRLLRKARRKAAI